MNPIEKLKSLHLCSDGRARYEQKYAGQFPTISDVIETCPQIDITHICLLGAELDDVFNYKNITRSAADKLTVSQWALLIAGQPHLIAYAPVEKFRAWHLFTMLSKQPQLIERIDATKITGQAKEKLLLLHPNLLF